MSKLRIIIELLIIVCCILTACQPTPEKPIVQSKNDGVFEDKVANEMPPEKYSAPASYSGRITKADVTLDIKATVSVPEADRFPVAHISKISMSDEWVQNFISCISIDGKAYSYKSELVYTKADVSDIIQNLMDHIEALKADKKISEADRAKVIKENEEELAMWQEYFKSAPDKFETEEIPISFNGDEYSKNFSCSVKTENNKSTIVLFTRTEQGGYVTVNIDTGDAVTLPTTYTDELPDGISKDEAIACAKDFIAKFDSGNFEPSYVCGGVMDPKENSRCLCIYFTRSVEGVTTSYRNNRFDDLLYSSAMNEKGKESAAYAPFWPQESICVYVGENGIFYMDWQMPAAQNNVVNKNVEMLKFDDVMDIFKKQMFLNGLFTNPNDEKIISRTVKITKIELGMMQVREKNSKDGLLMIPTRNFYGYEVYKFDDSYKNEPDAYPVDENNEYANNMIMGHSFLTINAIDGSIINPIFGF